MATWKVPPHGGGGKGPAEGPVGGNVQAFIDAGAQNPRGEGLRVWMKPIPGYTDKKLMPRGGFIFQCPPLEQIDYVHAFAHNDYDTVRGGQMSRAQGSQLITVQFDTLVVDWGAYTIVDGVIAEDFREQMQNVLDSGSPFLLTIAHKLPPGGFENWGATLVGPELLMPATLRQMTVTEKHGEGDARYFNVQFSEYRDPVIDRRKLGSGRSVDPKLPLTGWLTRDTGFFHYKVPHSKHTATVQGRIKTEHGSVPGAVTLADLARVFYGKPELAKHIAAANNLSWGAHSDLIKADVFRGKAKPKVKIPKPPHKAKR